MLFFIGMSSQVTHQRFQHFKDWMLEENFQFGMKRPEKPGELFITISTNK